MINNELQDVIQRAVGASGLDLYGSECVPGARGEKILRIYIEAPTGVTVEHCATVSRQVNALMHAAEIAGADKYRLEVSSPGLERRLLEHRHFESACGEKVAIKLLTAIDKRKNFEGILKGVDEQVCTLIIDDVEVTLPFANIAKAHVVAQW